MVKKVRESADEFVTFNEYVYPGYELIVKPAVLDNFGIKKVYQTADNAHEWYVNMDDPKSDPLFRNLSNVTFTKKSDGSWLVDASQIRLEAWSGTDAKTKWQNVEITGYEKMVAGTNHLLQQYSRGGHHTSTNPCEGSAMKGRLYEDKTAVVKEVNHPAYCGNRGEKALDFNAFGRWVGFKTVIYNAKLSTGKTSVVVEVWLDKDVQDANGNLVIKNDWQLSTRVVDSGGWATSDPDYKANCPVLNVDSTATYRAKSEILSKPGGTASANLCAWRSDDLSWRFKYLSAREIIAPVL